MMGQCGNLEMQGFTFDEFNNEFCHLVRSCVKSKNIGSLVDKYLQVTTAGSENDVKVTVDQAFREILHEHLAQNSDNVTLEEIIQQSVEAAEKDVCSGSLPLALLSDLFDCLTLDKCEQLFSLVEERVHVWKKDFFFKHCKNQLLRSCNDLLRRLSRSQNTVFCGRILVFLARFFPLSERSGLNIISEFNMDNLTSYSTCDEPDSMSDKDDSMEEGETNDSPVTISVDYNLYRKFWSLQEFFRQPTLCYNKLNWRQFTTYSGDVLSAFGSFKLDDVRGNNWKLEEHGSQTSDKPVYFAKYLTSQKLLELELSDSNFRRYVLVQFLILFQYLQSSVKFKQEQQVLADEQSSWVKETTQVITKLLEDTPPDGVAFTRHVEHILKREEFWNSWKNEGCPNFKEVQAEEKQQIPKPTRTKHKLGDDLKAAAINKRFLMGHSEMDRLWNLCPNNMEACKTSKRDFIPSLDNFFEKALKNIDSSRASDNQSLLNDSQFSWRALRLLSQRSPHFFTQSNQPIGPIPKYLEGMIAKLAKEKPHSMPQRGIANPDDVKAESLGGDEADSEDELLNNNIAADEKPDSTSDSKADLSGSGVEANNTEQLVSRTQCNQLAEDLKKDWKVLAPRLGFAEDEVLYFVTENGKDPVAQGRQCFTVWLEQEGPSATLTALKKALQDAGLTSTILDSSTNIS